MNLKAPSLKGFVFLLLFLSFVTGCQAGILWDGGGTANLSDGNFHEPAIGRNAGGSGTSVTSTGSHTVLLHFSPYPSSRNSDVPSTLDPFFESQRSKISTR